MSFETQHEKDLAPDPTSLAGSWLQFIEHAAERLHTDPSSSSVNVPDGVVIDHEHARRVTFDHFRDEIHPEVVEYVGRVLGLALEQVS